MIHVDGVRKATIRSHYQLDTLFYWLLWGPHIHHGLFSDDESSSLAQRRLIDTLAAMARLDLQDDVVDIGCGMGGSAIRLARQIGCRVTGVTLSPLQRHWAAASARLHGVGSQTRFLAEDAETIHFPEASFDVVWSVECTEHLSDKAAFIHSAAGWLRPGGRLAICVWFQGEASSVGDRRAQVEEVGRRFVCPSLATRQEYSGWIAESGLRVTESVDWTERVMKTWEICQRRIARSGVRWVARVLDEDQVRFLDGFDVLLDAYRSGAMQYGAIIAEKP